VNSWNHN